MRAAALARSRDSARPVTPARAGARSRFVPSRHGPRPCSGPRPRRAHARTGQLLFIHYRSQFALGTYWILHPLSKSGRKSTSPPPYTDLLTPSFL